MKCPLCHEERAELERRVASAALVAAWQRTRGIDVAGELRGVAEVELWRCLACDLRFFQPGGLAGSPELYAKLGGDEYYAEGKWEHAAALADLRGRLRVLEVGCGRGEFVRRASEVMGIKGIEINPAAVAAAQARGLPVRAADLQELAAQQAGQYDGVCAFQVLEHVADPAGFVGACCRLLSPGGRLVLAVPNADSYLRNTENVLDLPPHHLTRWSPAALGGLAGRFPLRLEYLRREPLAAGHVPGYVSSLCPQLSRWGGSRVVYHARFRAALAWLIARSQVRRLLLGQTLYATFTRI